VWVLWNGRARRNVRRTSSFKKPYVKESTLNRKPDMRNRNLRRSQQGVEPPFRGITLDLPVVLLQLLDSANVRPSNKQSWICFSPLLSDFCCVLVHVKRARASHPESFCLGSRSLLRDRIGGKPSVTQPGNSGPPNRRLTSSNSNAGGSRRE